MKNIEIYFGKRKGKETESGFLVYYPDEKFDFQIYETVTKTLEAINNLLLEGEYSAEISFPDRSGILFKPLEKWAIEYFPLDKKHIELFNQGIEDILQRKRR
jgi:phage pi2 protein 07